MSTLFPVVIASGFHLFPFRTEKLSPTAPMVLRKRESRSPPSYFQVEALPARLLGGLFVSLYRVNAALFRRVCDALCFARLGVGASRRAVLRIAAASAIEDFHKKAERFGYM